MMSAPVLPFPSLDRYLMLERCSLRADRYMVEVYLDEMDREWRRLTDADRAWLDERSVPDV